MSKPVAIVTGGSRGLGRGICQALSQHGYAVAINYAGNVQAAEETQKLLGDGADSLVCQGDIGNSSDRVRLVETTLARWDRIDLLVNNAGITSVGRLDILEATESSWDQVLAVNLKGPFFLTQQVARTMLDRAGRLQNPAIINITSVSAYALSVNRGDYCISKAGLGLATKLWAARLADHGIRVYEVRPGIIESDMTAGGREKYDHLIAEGLTPIRRWGKPEDVGQAVASLATGALPYSTGDAINIDGGYHLRRFP